MQVPGQEKKNVSQAEAVIHFNRNGAGMCKVSAFNLLSINTVLFQIHAFFKSFRSREKTSHAAQKMKIR